MLKSKQSNSHVLSRKYELHSKDTCFSKSAYTSHHRYQGLYMLMKGTRIQWTILWVPDVGDNDNIWHNVNQFHLTTAVKDNLCQVLSLHISKNLVETVVIHYINEPVCIVSFTQNLSRANYGLPVTKKLLHIIRDIYLASLNIFINIFSHTRVSLKIFKITITMYVQKLVV
jgi:hypothetical protein